MTLSTMKRLTFSAKSFNAFPASLNTTNRKDMLPTAHLKYARYKKDTSINYFHKISLNSGASLIKGQNIKIGEGQNIHIICMYI